MTIPARPPWTAAFAVFLFVTGIWLAWHLGYSDGYATARLAVCTDTKSNPHE